MEIFPMSKANLSDNVKKHLYDSIKSMDAKAGTKLPSENAIAQNLSVSRVTIRRALDELEQEGVIFRIHGRGTFINPEALEIQANLNPGMEFSKLIQASGYEAKFDVVGFEKMPADEWAAAKLQISLHVPIYVIEKLYYADGHPAIISIDRFPCNLLSEELTLEDVLSHSIFDLLKQKAGIMIARDKIEIQSVGMKRAQCISKSAKKMECETLLTFEGTNYDQDNQIVMCDSEFYDTKYIRFNLLRVKNVL